MRLAKAPTPRRVGVAFRLFWSTAAGAVQLVGWRRAAGPATHRVTFEPDAAERAGAARVVPVVMCVWQRIDRLAETLSLLEAQEAVQVDLYVWNNNRAAVARVEEIVRTTACRRVRVVLTHSARNIGGFGRFYLARELSEHHSSVVFVDDDLVFSSDAVRRLIEEHRPCSLASQWAFRLLDPNDYDRREPLEPGERADYCGTGGMIADSSIFRDERLFRCPRRFWFIEDLWLSFHASHVLGWELRKSGVSFEELDDGLNQFGYLHRRKSRFLRYLVRRGWDVPFRDGHRDSRSLARPAAARSV